MNLDTLAQHLEDGLAQVEKATRHNVLRTVADMLELFAGDLGERRPDPTQAPTTRDARTVANRLRRSAESENAG